MSRLINAGSVVYDQLDWFNPNNSINRAPGLTIAAISFLGFVNNSVLIWNFADGTSVLDSSISAGTVYFNEITGQPGYYQIRFYPDRVGIWRLTFRQISLQIEIIKEYDVLPVGTLKPGATSAGLIPSFSVSGPNC